MLKEIVFLKLFIFFTHLVYNNVPLYILSKKIVSSLTADWGSWWSLYWCFGSTHKSNKRIGHAVLVPEPVAPAGLAATMAPNPSTTIVMLFIVPPSSPASFLQSDPPSATHSPAGLLSLTVNSYSSGGPASICEIWV
ncbi:hypothetical protein HN51_069614 [Arachis hypogaea]